MSNKTNTKILQIACEMTQNQGGPSFSANHLSDYFVGDDHKILIIGNLDKYFREKLMKKQRYFEVIKSTFGNKSGLCVVDIRKLLIEIFAHDIIISHGFYTFPTLIVSLFTRKKRIYIMPHGSLEEYQSKYGRLRKFIFDLLFNLNQNTKRISFAVATEQESLSVKRKFHNRVTVVGIGIDIPQHTLYKENNSVYEINLISVSRIAKKKRIDLSIQALAILKRMNIEAHLWIYGDGDRRLVEILEKLSSELGVTENVHFEGAVLHDSIEGIYETRKIFLLPSENENFAIAVAESIAYQTPVVISSNVALSTFVETNRCGQVISELEPNELARAILHVHSNYDAYEAACKSVRHKLAHQSVKEAWFSLLQSELENS